LADHILVDEPTLRVQPAKLSYTIPDFRADDAAIKALDAKLAHLISISLQAGMDTVRAKHAARRKELVASAVFFENLAREAAGEISAATKEFNASVNRNTIDRQEMRAAPTLLFEEITTLGRAGRRHRAMLRAEAKSAKLAKRVREAQIAVEKHDALLAPLLTTRETEWRKHFESEEGHAELLRDQRIAKAAAAADAINAERKAFEKRLKAGDVGIDELRAREMAREKLAFLGGKVDGLYFTGEAKYGEYRYFRLRDRTGRDWLLDWDEELLDLERFEFNIAQKHDGSYTVERAIWSDRRVGESRLHDPKRTLTDGADLRLIAALREFKLDLEDPWRAERAAEPPAEVVEPDDDQPMW
jgi:hypothetical protein